MSRPGRAAVLRLVDVPDAGARAFGEAAGEPVDAEEQVVRVVRVDRGALQVAVREARREARRGVNVHVPGRRMCRRPRRARTVRHRCCEHGPHQVAIAAVPEYATAVKVSGRPRAASRPSASRRRSAIAKPLSWYQRLVAAGEPLVDVLVVRRERRDELRVDVGRRDVERRRVRRDRGSAFGWPGPGLRAGLRDLHRQDGRTPGRCCSRRPGRRGRRRRHRRSSSTIFRLRRAAGASRRCPAGRR